MILKKLSATGFTERGSRSVNQDRILFLQNGLCGLYVVADGMGGHEHGERASEYLTGLLGSEWEKALSMNSYSERIDFLHELILKANRDIWESTPEHEITGCTVVLLLIEREYYTVMWAGDSRCYAAKKKLFRIDCDVLTFDDVWENDPANSENLSEEEIRASCNRQKLIRAVGAFGDFDISLRSGVINGNMLFCLCSDGIYKYCDPNVLKKRICSALKTGELKHSEDAIRAAVVSNSAPDNMSMILVRCTG